MNDLTIKEIRELEGLSKNAHQSLEEIVRRITRGEEPCFTLAQEEANYDSSW